MRCPPIAQLLPKPIWLLVAIYFAASLAHFSHNAEYIAFYPGMPDWLSRETVYLAWLGVTAVGVVGIAALRLGFSVLGATLVAAYGAFGLDGLAHYSLALCSAHTLVANITIWSEAASGLCLLLAASVYSYRLWALRSPSSVA
jgi:hypothetical protein